jgi:hypothetical protein
MILDGAHVSLCDRRIKVIVDVLREDPESAPNAAMSEDTVRRLATSVLHALDQIPQAARYPRDSAMSTPGAVRQEADGFPDLEVVDMATCPACPHPLVTHDAIGTRFCRATIARALRRGCTCPAR